MRFETKSLRSHALDLFIEHVNFLFMQRGFGFLRVSLAQLVKRFLDGELRGVGHAESLFSTEANFQDARSPTESGHFHSAGTRSVRLCTPQVFFGRAEPGRNRLQARGPLSLTRRAVALFNTPVIVPIPVCRSLLVLAGRGI